MRPELTPEWEGLGINPCRGILLRQLLSISDFAEFRARLSLDFPGESFLIVRYGDHQPDFAGTMSRPASDEPKLPNADGALIRAITNLYAIDVLHFQAGHIRSARDGLEGPYLPLVIQEIAGLPLDPTFASKKRILERCAGYFLLWEGAEARRFQPVADRRRLDQEISKACPATCPLPGIPGASVCALARVAASCVQLAPL